MDPIISRNYRRSRFKNRLRNFFARALQMGLLVVIGEGMLIHVINISLTSMDQGRPTLLSGRSVPNGIVDLAVSERPILRMAQTYDTLKRSVEFDRIIERQYPVHIKGSRPETRPLDLQDQEGAKIGYVLKF
jgi:hypothetical protein